MDLAFGILSLIAAWISLKAAPLGSKPYRWGVYTGITTALSALRLILSSIPALNDLRLPVEGVWLVAVGSIAAVAAAGILLRKKFGVVALVVLWVAYIIVLFPTIQHVPIWVAYAFFAVYALGTGVYFKERWSLLG